MLRSELLKKLHRYDDGIPASLRELTRGAELSEDIGNILVGLFKGSESAENGSYIDRISSALLDKSSNGGELSVNTFPFGVETDQTFPKFIGVSVGKEKAAPTLDGILSKAKKHCEIMEKKFALDTEKTVVILTDKWDNPLFRKKYEIAFLNYAIRQNIMFYFILVTDYGVTRIPFLVRDRRGLEQLRSDDLVEDDIQAARKLLAEYDCYYRWDCKEWPPFDNGTYEFDFYSKRYHFIGDHGQTHQGKIPDEAIDSFASAVRCLYDLPKSEYDEQCMSFADTTNCYYEAELFGKTFRWDLINMNHFYEPCLQIVSDAFQELVNSLR